MPNHNDELQAQLAVEHMSAKHCKECPFYCYGKEDEVCLFHSSPIENCNVVNLHLSGELYATSIRKEFCKNGSTSVRLP